MRRLLCILLACVSALVSMGQRLDSLVLMLDSTQHDTLQAALNYRIGSAYALSSQAEPYMERTIALCEELSLSPEPSVRAFAEALLPFILNSYGVNMQARGDHLRAATLLRRAGDLYEQLGDTPGVIQAENNLGLLSQKVGDRQRAMEHFHRALSLARSSRDTVWTTSLMARMAPLFVEMGELDSAEIYLNESLKDRASSSLDYRYRNQALLREKQGRIAEAVMLLDSSVAVSRHERHDWITGSSYLHLARILEQNGRREKAMVALDSCLAHFENGDMVYYCQCLQVHGTIASTLGRQAQAEKDLTRALTIAGEVGQVQTQLLATASLRDLYRRTGRYELAFRMADQWQVLADSVNALDAKSELLSMDFRNAMRTDSLSNAAESEHARMESEARLSKERTRRNVLLGFGAFALVFAVVDLRRRRRIKKEHARSEALLLNILPAEVAEELKAKGEAEAKLINEVTVLFTDFKGFTAMSEQLTPKELVRDIHECFSAFDRIMEKHGIEKIKTIGDAYMAAGGLPTPNTTHATDVVKAALEVRDFIAEGKAHKLAHGLPFFEIRIGVHTGPVVAGIVGVKKFAYDIWGDTVNTASRMESSGEVGQVNISESTYALVHEQAGSLFYFTPRGKVQAKGKGEMEMFFVRRSGEAA